MGDKIIDDSIKQLIVAFYLAKFNEDAIKNLGFKSYKSTFEHVGSILGYKSATIKNRRDDFDPLFEHRAGWHKVELSQRHLEIVENFDHLSESALRALVVDILNGEDLETINIEKKPKDTTFTTRGVTGKKAEEHFIKWFKNEYPTEVLIDTRDLGCGYDFKVKDSRVVYEVKGLSANDGGILFTDKEWSTARSKKNNYILVLIRNCLSQEPKLEIYPNPSEKYTPSKQISTIINVNWAVSSTQIKDS